VLALIMTTLIYEAKIDLSGLFDIKRIHIFLSFYLLVALNRALRFSSMLFYYIPKYLKIKNR